jgi:uroporphyrinogen-III synthase
MVGALGRQWLRNTPLVVISDRMLQLAQELGIQGPVEIADQASDEGIVAALCRLRKRMTTGKEL